MLRALLPLRARCSSRQRPMRKSRSLKKSLKRLLCSVSLRSQKRRPLIGMPSWRSPKRFLQTPLPGQHCMQKMLRTSQREVSLFFLLAPSLAVSTKFLFFLPFFQLVGLGYVLWFAYRYLLFSENRKELMDLIQDFLGKL
mmetsp:Transcript_26209/g.45098  ORF Transcript_26209/g.45098 Transcript_26209/m.45098 type:complete len:140 (+) Transcript_26209:295-714(+)